MPRVIAAPAAGLELVEKELDPWKTAGCVMNTVDCTVVVIGIVVVTGSCQVTVVVVGGWVTVVVVGGWVTVVVVGG